MFPKNFLPYRYLLLAFSIPKATINICDSPHLFFEGKLFLYETLAIIGHTQEGLRVTHEPLEIFLELVGVVDRKNYPFVPGTIIAA